MSPDIKPGQNARAIRNTKSNGGVEVVKNAQVTVEAHFGGPEFMARLEAQAGLIFRVADFEPVEPPEPFTPASLDPAAVKAGDTVTVEIVDDTDVPPYTVTGVVYAKHDGLHVGQVWLYAPGARLTDHQPAPEPGWTLGEVAEISVRGCSAAPLTTLKGLRRDGGWLTSGGSWDDVNVESVRPLVVIDPGGIDGLVEEIAGAAHVADSDVRRVLLALIAGGAS